MAIMLAGFSLAGAAPPPTTETPQADGKLVEGSHTASHVEWGYTGANGPDHWSELGRSYAICNGGQQESPIDLAGAIPADLGKLAIAWQLQPLAATNNGHTVQFDAVPGSSFTMAGKTYQLVQFHIHHPGEHLVDGRRFPLEIHFVHRAGDGSFGVIGVLVETGAANAALQSLLDTVPVVADTKRSGGQFDLHRLLPLAHGYFRYEGSLTTPPCSESVDWVVMRQLVTASPAQIAQFATIFPFNARPIQAIDRRFLLRSR
jgi:carbonic anhydrase